ncbi:MAG: hypothetical protein IJ083_10005 [Clostridia bacterium]|nr:hypothetical protein [Clostridia bacterium]
MLAYARRTVRSEHLYQIFTCVKNREAELQGDATRGLRDAPLCLDG